MVGGGTTGWEQEHVGVGGSGDGRAGQGQTSVSPDTRGAETLQGVIMFVFT